MAPSWTGPRRSVNAVGNDKTPRRPTARGESPWLAQDTTPELRSHNRVSDCFPSNLRATAHGRAAT